MLNLKPIDFVLLNLVFFVNSKIEDLSCCERSNTNTFIERMFPLREVG